MNSLRFKIIKDIGCKFYIAILKGFKGDIENCR